MFFKKGNDKRIKVTFLIIGWCLMIGSGHLLAQEEDLDSVEHEAGLYYTVKKGDTLWDISQHFSDSPWLWPDLWNENQQVPNPHWIYPGDRVRLYHGKGKEEYSIQQAQVTMEPITEPPRKGAYLLYSSINMAGFIRKKPVIPSGTIFKSRGDRKLLSVGDMIYVNPVDKNTSQFMPGAKYTIFRMIAPTKAPKSKKKIGTQHYILGIAEIISNEEAFAIAKIIYAIRAIHLEDHLMPFKRKSPAILVSDSTENIKGNIIISEEHHRLIGDYMVAFINRGEQDNIIVGQRYNLFEQEMAKIDRKKKVTLPPIDIGSLIVIHTEKTNSTVLITNSLKHFTPGTKIRTPVY